MAVKKEYWPCTTSEEYSKSLCLVKNAFLISTYHLRAILIDMKEEVFKDNYIFMGDLKCEPARYNYLKEWYEHCIENLLPETLDLVNESTPFQSAHSKLYEIWSVSFIEKSSLTSSNTLSSKFIMFERKIYHFLIEMTIFFISSVGILSENDDLFHSKTTT